MMFLYKLQIDVNGDKKLYKNTISLNFYANKHLILLFLSFFCQKIKNN